MLGGMLVSAGMVTAAFSQKVYHMYIAIGVVSGERLPGWYRVQRLGVGKEALGSLACFLLRSSFSLK